MIEITVAARIDETVLWRLWEKGVSPTTNEPYPLFRRRITEMVAREINSYLTRPLIAVSETTFALDLEQAA